MKQKVLVGLSGGVDSAVAAALLADAGYEVEGMFIRNSDLELNNDDCVCSRKADYLDAEETARQLNIKLHSVDFVSEYKDRVFSVFLNEYRRGRTPNPDIVCNREIKFRCFLDYALQSGYDYIAMGHYAVITHDDGVKVYKGFDRNKDQTYFLSQLTREQLKHVLFPLGGLTKDEVRAIATRKGLKVATKKDSTGVCFIGESRFRPFLRNYLKPEPGDIETPSGEKVGRHEGLMLYTIGQRHGLSLGGEGKPWYVLGKDRKRNVLIAGRGWDHPMLYSDRCVVTDVNWLGDEELSHDKYLEVSVKFRYRSKETAARIRLLDDGRTEILYPEKFRAVTPGQAAVFYLGERLAGGGTIDEVFMNGEKREY